MDYVEDKIVINAESEKGKWLIANSKVVNIPGIINDSNS